MARSSYLRLAPFLLLFTASTLAQAVVDLPPRMTYVNDDAHVLSAETTRDIQRVCDALARSARAQLFVVTVDTTAEEPIATYGNQLEQQWQIGGAGSPRSALLLVATGDRRWFVSGGSDFQELFTKEEKDRIGREMNIYLRLSKHDEGLTIGTEEVADLIAKSAGVALPVPRVKLPPIEDRAAFGPAQFLIVAAIALLLAIIAVRMRVLSRLRSKRASD